MKDYEIRSYDGGTTTIKLDLRKLTQLRFGVKDLGESTARACAEIMAEHIRANWSGYVPPRSRPGQPPAIDTGNLDESIELMRRSVTGQGVTWIVRANPQVAPYAELLEYGTRMMAARPFMRPAAETARKQIKELASKQLNEVLNSRLV